MNEIRKQLMVFSWPTLLLSAGLVFGQVDDRVIMKVNGHVIRACEIAVALEAVAKDTKLSDEEVEQAILKRQKLTLRNRIRQIIFDEALSRYGIAITEEEITGRVDKSFSDADITDDVAIQIKQKGLQIAKSLKDVIVHGADRKDVYSAGLDNLITQQEWDAYLSNYDTEEKIEALIKALPKNVADMKANSRTSARNDLEAEKVEQRICADLSVTDEDISSYCQRRLQKDPEELSPELRKKIKKRILTERQREAKREWWKKQISEADVEVLDPRFEKIKNTILKELSSTEDPRKTFSQRSRDPSKSTAVKQK